MANDKIKNLTATELKKQVKKLDKQREVTIFIELPNEEIGELEPTPYNVKIDEVFRNTKQHKVLDDMVEFLNEGQVQPFLIDLTTPYISLLLIKHFTNIEVSDDIDEAMETLNALTDLEALDKILNVLPESEVEKMYELLQKTLENVERNLQAGEEEEDRLASEIENKVVKGVLVDGKE